MVTPRVSGNNYLRKSAKSAGGYLDATDNVMCIYTRHGDTLTAGERPIYGTKRLGELRQQIILGTNGSLLRCDNATIGTRHYELTDHLGNVMAVVSDRKTLSPDSVYYPVVISATDYYPFGYPIADRSSELGEYRYGFNEQESDNEVYGEKQMFEYEFRQYDSRLGRWWGIDPMADKYPSMSPYVYCANNPVKLVDLNGMEYGEPPYSQEQLQKMAKNLISTIKNEAVNYSNRFNTSTKWVVMGQYINSTEGKKTDTQLGSAKEYNMYVNYGKVFSVSESNASSYNNYEAYMVACMMVGFVSGTGPENYDFPENGIISSAMLNSSVVQQALEGFKEGNYQPRQFTFNINDLFNNFLTNNTNVFNIESMVGSATVSITPTKNGMLSITIFNITSLTSGAYFKDIYEKITGSSALFPISITRDSNQQTPYGNISQTFHLLIPNQYIK